jgi:hypothetical protein
MANAGKRQQYLCAGCGVMVERFPSQVAGKQRVFHSVECKDNHPIPRHPRPPREELEAIYANCRSFREVGEIYGASHSTVWAWMKHYDIKPHRVAAERRIASNGYVVVRPEMLDGEWRLEHRVVWERAHGPIPPNCTIHHINRDGKAAIQLGVVRATHIAQPAPASSTDRQMKIRSDLEQ